MKIEGLKSLYQDMKNNNLERYKILFTFNKVSFDVFFFIDESPFILMFGVKHLNFYFEVQVKPGFKIDPLLDNDTYSRLVTVLNLTFDPDRPFKPTYFFEEFNKNIPHKVDFTKIPKPHEIGQFRKNIEESEKIYFLGWKDNNTRNEKVSPENLMKTQKLLGKMAYEKCKQKNISSRWTDDISLAQNHNPPKISQEYLDSV